MFEDIFTGIMFILFGIGIFAFGIFTTRQKMAEVQAININILITTVLKITDLLFWVVY